MSGLLLVPRPLGAPGSLARDYVTGDSRARALFPGAGVPAERRTPPGRAALPVEAVQVTPGAETHLEAILSGEGWLVSTGQQPDLFVGPLYVVYKALTALELARRIESETGRPSLPVFWVASDDHDWHEVSCTRVVDARGKIHEIRLEPDEGFAHGAVGTAPLPVEVEGAITALGDAVGRTQHWNSYEALIRDAYRPGRAYGEAFTEALRGILGDRKFAWVDSGSSEVRRAATAVYRDVLERPADVDAAIEAGTAAVTRAGYAAQLRHVPGSPPIFIDTDGGRVRLRSEPDGFRLGPEGSLLSVEEMLALLEAEPERFTPSAALRPVVESRLLPIAATALGPGEIAYWAQLGPLFAELDASMPRVVGRNAWLIVDDRTRSVLDKVGAAPTDVTDGGALLAARLVEAGRPEAVESALSGLRRAVESGMTELEVAVGGELPGVRASVGKTGKRLRSTLADLGKAIDRKVREEGEVVLGRVTRVAAGLFPSGVEQERVQSPFYFLARQGPDLIDALEREGAKSVEDRP